MKNQETGANLLQTGVVGGVGNTPPINTMKYGVCIDYLTLTFTLDVEINQSIESVFKVFNTNSYKCQYYEKGRNGYKQMYKINEHIDFLLNGPQNSSGLNTMCIEMSGQGCREFEEMNIMSWQQFISTMIGRFNAKFTRIDIAIDDFICEHADLDKILEYLEGGHYVSHFKGPYLPIFPKKPNRDTGVMEVVSKSIQFGKKGSEIMLFMYDKYLKYLADGISLHGVKKMVRYEIRLAQSRADLFCKQFELYEDNLFQYCLSLLYGLLDIKKKDDDRNKSRLPTVSWWKKFINNQEKVRLVNYSKVEQSITRKINWFERSVAKSLLQIYLSNPTDFMPFVVDILKNKSDDLKKDDVLAVNNYFKSIGVDKEISQFEINQMIQELKKYDDEDLISYDLKDVVIRNVHLGTDLSIIVDSCPIGQRIQKLTGVLYADLNKDCQSCPFFIGSKKEKNRIIACLCKKRS